MIMNNYYFIHYTCIEILNIFDIIVHIKKIFNDNEIGFVVHLTTTYGYPNNDLKEAYCLVRSKNGHEPNTRIGGYEILNTNTAQILNSFVPAEWIKLENNKEFECYFYIIRSIISNFQSYEHVEYDFDLGNPQYIVFLKNIDSSHYLIDNDNNEQNEINVCVNIRNEIFNSYLRNFLKIGSNNNIKITKVYSNADMDYLRKLWRVKSLNLSFELYDDVNYISNQIFKNSCRLNIKDHINIII